MAITLDGSDNKIAIGANATGSAYVRLYEDTDNGTNYVDIIAPASITSNRTLTLPDNTGTILTSATTTGFPAGSVIQVVSATSSTQTTSSSATYADSTLSASITPTSASSKILVLVNQAGCIKAGSNTRGLLKLLRGSTDLIEFEKGFGASGNSDDNAIGSCSACYLDSPATTSSTTYKTQVANQAAAGSVIVQWLSSVSTITLMEIAA